LPPGFAMLNCFSRLTSALVTLGTSFESLSLRVPHREQPITRHMTGRLIFISGHHDNHSSCSQGTRFCHQIQIRGDISQR
jgi:hypothetical protein